MINYRQPVRNEVTVLIIILIGNIILKIIPAAFLELGNDEVYYLTYALFPDWSHFDHPPMVGLLIQLFTLNMKLNNEIFIRAGALILSSASIVLVFSLVKRLYSLTAAYIAVTLFVTSFYLNIISGLFIIPDTPQIFFVVVALYFLLPSITIKEPDKNDKLNIFFFGIFTGFAFLSKYHSLFLWLGAGLYILIHNRIWLKKGALYWSMLATLCLMLPVLYWNFRNGFISFTFHGGRVGLLNSPLDHVSFLRFNAGEFFYQNPISFCIYIILVFKLLRNIRSRISQVNIILLYLGIPLIIVFTLLSLFRNTLPHWSGPAFICLLIMSSGLLASEYEQNRRRVINLLSGGMILFIVVLVAGMLQIQYGFFSMGKDKDPARLGKYDFTLDMYGWKDSGNQFANFLEKEGIGKEERTNLVIISDNWFPGAHIDHYIASPLEIKLLVPGSIDHSHKYFWINKIRKINCLNRIFYLTDSRNFRDPGIFSGYFSRIIPRDTLKIKRKNKVVKYLYIYEMSGCSGNISQD